MNASSGHADLFDATTWRRWQRMRADGGRIELFAYRDEVGLGAG